MKLSYARKGKPKSEEHKKRIGDAQRGEKNHNYGKTLSVETKRKMSDSRKGKMCGEKHPLYGKKHSEETLKKMSERKKGEKHPLYGKKHSEETLKKLSERKKGALNCFDIEENSFVRIPTDIYYENRERYYHIRSKVAREFRNEKNIVRQSSHENF